MNEPIWTTKPIVRPEPREFEYTTTVEGLSVKVTENGGWSRWVIDGFVQDIRCFAMGHDSKRPIEDTKAGAVGAAQRLYVAGWRGEESYPVSCCDRLLPTRADAERHEAGHKAELAEDDQ